MIIIPRWTASVLIGVQNYARLCIFYLVLSHTPIHVPNTTLIIPSAKTFGRNHRTALNHLFLPQLLFVREAVIIICARKGERSCSSTYTEQIWLLNENENTTRYFYVFLLVFPITFLFSFLTLTGSVTLSETIPYFNHT